jgi:hypothetical protein
MTTVEAVLDRARSQIGTSEHPPGSNRVLYADWYGVHGPWCAMFVSWCFYHEGLPLTAETAKGFCYTPRGANWFRANGRWTSNPAPGHVVFFDFPGDGVDRISHVGIVERVDGSAITTIEGNTDVAGGRTGGQVLRKVRRGGVIGYGLPAYAGNGGHGGGAELRRGSRGEEVRRLQRRLVELGVAPLTVDGDFGARTEEAVRRFQVSCGLAVDGIVGPRTRARLWPTR